MLVGVFSLDKSHATHRWFRVGPVSLQPSELAKLAVILYLAWFLELRSRPRSFGVNDVLHTLAPALGLVLMMAGLVVLEPDLGTSLEILIIAMAMLFVAGLSGKYIRRGRGRGHSGDLFRGGARLLSLRAGDGLPASGRRSRRATASN